MLTADDLEEAHDFAARLAVRAGQMLRQNAWERIQHAWQPPSDPSSSTSSSSALNEQLKNGSSTDIVTDVDISVEQFVVSELKERYGSRGWQVLAEEEYAAKGDNRYLCGQVSVTLFVSHSLLF
jgi:stalled ribosome rescue protein Dom34